MAYNQNSGYGQALLNMVASVCPVFGKVYITFNANDTDERNYQMLQEICKEDPDGVLRFHTSLETLLSTYLESNNNDVVLLDANSSHTVEAGVAMALNRVNFIGMDGGERIFQQGAKIQTTGNPDDAYLWKDTGNRNSYRNIKFIQNSTDAAALTGFQFGGEGTLMKNCSVTFGTATNLDGNETTTYEVVFGGDSCTIKECNFGTSTLTTTGARAVMLIDQVTASQECKDNYIKDCLFTIQSSSSSADFIRIAATTDSKFTNTLVNPIFNNALVSSTSAVALDDAIRSISGLVEGNWLVVNPATNTGELCTDVTDQIKTIGFGLGKDTNPDQYVGIAVTPA